MAATPQRAAEQAHLSRWYAECGTQNGRETHSDATLSLSWDTSTEDHGANRQVISKPRLSPLTFGRLAVTLEALPPMIIGDYRRWSARAADSLCCQRPAPSVVEGTCVMPRAL